MQSEAIKKQFKSDTSANVIPESELNTNESLGPTTAHKKWESCIKYLQILVIVFCLASVVSQCTVGSILYLLGLRNLYNLQDSIHSIFFNQDVDSEIFLWVARFLFAAGVIQIINAVLGVAAALFRSRKMLPLVWV